MDTNTQAAPAEQPEGEEKSFHLPAEVLSGEPYKEGDTITLKVISVDPDGGCTVEVDDGDDKEEGQGQDWRTDLRQTMSDAKGDQ